MSFYKPLNNIIEESKSNMDLEHVGVVVDNNDPLKLYRVKVMIDIWAEIPIEFLPWATPKTVPFLGLSRNNIMIAIPEVGTEVSVKFPTKDKYHPEYSGTNLTSSNKCNFFDEDYPNSYGFKDSVGNFFKINKLQKNIKLQHSSGTNFEIYSIDGDIVLKHCDFKDEENDKTIPGAYIRIDKYGKIYHSCVDYQVDASNSVLINTKDFRMDASNSVLINTLNTTINSQVLINGNETINGNESISGSENVGGGITAGGDVLGGGISLDNHTHFAPHEAGNTSPPQ